MVKFDFSPASSAWRRSSLTPIEWKVPSQGMPSTVAAEKNADALLHLARRLVGEGHRKDLVGPGGAGGQRCAIRCRQRRVLPVPAPASIRTGPSSRSTASRWAGFNPSR
jgi:hypothetical protein